MNRLCSVLAMLGVLVLGGCASSPQRTSLRPLPSGFADSTTSPATPTSPTHPRTPAHPSVPGSTVTASVSITGIGGPVATTPGAAISSAVAGVATTRPVTPATTATHGTPVAHPSSSGRAGPPLNSSCPAPVPPQSGSRWQQSIWFPSPGSHSYPDSHVVLGACASSGLPVSYSLASNTNCVLSGADLDVVAVPADCSVVAQQAGNASWAPAAPVTRAFHVGYQYVDASWGPPDPSVPISLGAGSFIVDVTLSSTSSFQVGDVRIDSDNTSICQNADWGTVTASRSTTVHIPITLGGTTGFCTLTIVVDGSALSVANRVQPPRAYHVLA